MGDQLEVVDQVAMADIGQGPELLFEKVDVAGTGLVRDLERDQALPFLVKGLVDHSKGTRAQAPPELEPVHSLEVLHRTSP